MELHPAIEHSVIAVSAVSGVLAAHGRRIDLFGIIVLALVTAFGGGTLRDLLTGSPVGWLHDSWKLLNATLAAVFTFFIAPHVRLAHRSLDIIDAFALAGYAILGTNKGLICGVSPAGAVFLGVVTGTAGGMIRDLLLGEVPAIFRPDIRLYATAALAGCIIDVLLRSIIPAETAAATGIITIAALRLAAMRWRLSLPVFKSKI